MNKIHLILPFIPVSLNEAYAGYKVRHKSNKYKEFENKLEKYFLELGEKFEITGDNWLQLSYTLYIPLFYKNGNKKKQDIGNYEKALSDCLAHHIIGFKDENIKILIARKVDSEKLETELEILELT